MKRRTKLTALLMAGAMALGLAACGGTPSTQSQAPEGSQAVVENLPADVQAIVDRGTLRVGVKTDVPGFGMQELSGGYSGLEIDLAKKIAEAMGLSADDVEFTAVTAKTRGQLLDSGDIDMVIATFTVNDERRETWNFSTSYYADTVSLLVKNDSGISTYADLSDKTIGVAEAATSKEALIAAAAENGVTLGENNFQVYPDYPSIKAALDAGQIDAFCMDGSTLTGYVDDSTVILPDIRFAPQEYAIATKLSNTGLAEFVDGLVTGWLADGTIDQLITDNGVTPSYEG